MVVCKYLTSKVLFLQQFLLLQRKRYDLPGRVCPEKAVFLHYLLTAVFEGFLADKVEVAAVWSRGESSNLSWTFRSELPDKGQPLILRK